MRSNNRGSLGFLAAAGVAAFLTGCSGGSSGSGSSAANAASSTSQSVSSALSGTPQTVVEAGTAYSFTPAVARASSDEKMTYSISNKPVWASFDTTTGTLSGSPAMTYVGVYSQIEITASNGAQTFALAPFSIAVAQAEGRVNTGELGIAGTPAQTAVVGQAYSFSPTVSDPAGAAYSFSIANKPEWATFDTLTGRLSGTPVAADVGVDSKIEITISDGGEGDTLPAFSISVGLTAAAVASTATPVSVPAAATAPNTEPTGVTSTQTSSSTTALSIAGSPAETASVGTAYSFTPTVNGPAGVTYSYTVANLPSWASFSASTGKLSGTPAAGSVGTDTQIAISVSDGSAKATLAAFSIAVGAGADESVTLSWTEPTINANGTAITGLAGYHVYYGPSATSLTHMVAVNSPADTDEVLSNLAPGTWYIGVKSFNNDNVESALSAVVTVTL